MARGRRALAWCYQGTGARSAASAREVSQGTAIPTAPAKRSGCSPARPPAAWHRAAGGRCKQRWRFRGLTAPTAQGSVLPCGLAPGAPAGPTPPVPPCAGSCRSPPGLGPQLAVSAPGRRGARLPLALGCPWLRRRSHKSSLGSLCCGCRHSRLGPRRHRGRGLGCLAWEGFLVLSAPVPGVPDGSAGTRGVCSEDGHGAGCAVGSRWRAWRCTAVRAGQALRVPSGSTTRGRPLVRGLVGIRGLRPCLRLRGGLPSCRWLEPDGKSRPS